MEPSIVCPAGSFTRPSTKSRYGYNVKSRMTANCDLTFWSGETGAAKAARCNASCRVFFLTSSNALLDVRAKKPKSVFGRFQYTSFLLSSTNPTKSGDVGSGLVIDMCSSFFIRIKYLYLRKMLLHKELLTCKNRFPP